jgi:hypothetical protein
LGSRKNLLFFFTNDLMALVVTNDLGSVRIFSTYSWLLGKGMKEARSPSSSVIKKAEVGTFVQLARMKGTFGV